ncbi:MAG TPA: hypothetical protein VIE42_15710 [Steroidobacteraceae bacterium]
MTITAGWAGVLGLAVLLGLPAAPAGAESEPAIVELPAGAHIGIVNLLDPEITHFHAAKVLQDSFLKTYTVDWPVAAMLTQVLQARLTQLGFAPVALETSAALRDAREACFLNASLAKSLPKECRLPFGQFTTANHVDALIVLGPGLNDAAHAAGGRHKELPEYLRGWCLVSGEGAAAAAPSLLNLTELLLLRPTEKGAELGARQWGGNEVQAWIGFTAPKDLKVLEAAQLDQTRPLYAAMLSRQVDGLLTHLHQATAH